MVRVAEDNMAIKVFKLLRSQTLHGSLCTNRHEHGQISYKMWQMQPRDTSLRRWTFGNNLQM
jgi:hypothetical protein